MIGFLKSITGNNLRVLRKPMLTSMLRSVFQGQPFFVILMVMLELFQPLMEPGTGVNTAKLIGYSIWLMISVLMLFMVSVIGYKSEATVAYELAADGRLRLGDHLRKLSMGFFRSKDPGDLTSLMLSDYSNIEVMLGNLLMNAVSAVVLPVLFIVFLLPFDWRMTLITTAPIPVAFLAALITRAIIQRTGKRHIGAKNEATSRMLEYLDGMKNIKAYNLHGTKFDRLRKSFHELKRISIKQEAVAGPSVILGLWCLNAGIALIMIVGITFVVNGSLPLPVFLVFLILGTRMYDPLSMFLVQFVELSYFSISAKRLREIHNSSPLPSPEEAAAPESFDIEFDRVGFHYHEADVLKEVSFRLPEHSMTALVGPSGSGKSTITRLIARFWDVNEGHVRIGGKPVSAYRTEDLLAQISMVFQEVYLFNDTILNNILVGRSDAGMDEVLEAAEKARCREFIEKMPDGFNTMVGEGGASLSGGEKQRISIARAILKNAPIILLDEATASLDPENELYIQEAIAELIRDRTLVVIAHRLSTITGADQILVLKEGEIVERGRHEELLARGGAYAAMWNEQKHAHHWKLAAGT
ncbi:MAG: multidrug ABC transporter [Bacteroidetes bacterium]|nr:MAG: multidrug ABC transporter [Bacteroidota bacterium]